MRYEMSLSEIKVWEKEAKERAKKIERRGIPTDPEFLSRYVKVLEERLIHYWLQAVTHSCKKSRDRVGYKPDPEWVWWQSMLLLGDLREDATEVD